MTAAVLVRPTGSARPRGAGARAVLGALVVVAALVGGTRPAAAQVGRQPGVVFVSSTPTDRSAWNHQVASGADRYVIVAVTLGPDGGELPRVTSVRFGGLDMSYLGSSFNGTQVRVELWGLPDPPVGLQAVDLRLTVRGAVVAGSVSFEGVDLSGPIGPVVADASSGSLASLTVSSAPGEMVFDVYGSPGETPTLRGSRTVHWNESNRIAGASSSDEGARTVSPTWANRGGTHTWAMAAVALKPRPPVVAADAGTSPPDTGSPPPQPDASAGVSDGGVLPPPEGDASIGVSDGGVLPPPEGDASTSEGGAVPPPFDAAFARDGATTDGSDGTDGGRPSPRDGDGGTSSSPSPDAGPVQVARNVDYDLGCACHLAGARRPIGAASSSLVLVIVAALVLRGRRRKASAPPRSTDTTP